MILEDKISVIVCTYNQQQTIARALDSILRQRCVWPIEIIIGEDCSTDKTQEICADYAARYPQTIKLLSNARNKGILNNYYDCLLEASGKYIADLAGDDEWCDPRKLEKERLLLEEHPEVVLVHTDYRLRDEKTGDLHLAPFYPYPKNITDGKQLIPSILTQRSRPVVHLCTAMYRTEAFRACYQEHTTFFRNTDYPCEDMQLCALLAQRGQFAYIDSITLTYSLSCSISKTHDEARQFRFVQGITQLSHDLQETLQLSDNKTLRNYFSYRIFALLMHAFRAHDQQLRSEALQCAQRWHARLEGRSRMVLFFTSNDVLWRMALSLRKKLLQLRRH